MDTDEFLHAVGGYEIYWEIAKGSLGGFWNAILAQSFYPPLGKLPIVISYLVGGVSTTTARIPGLILLAISMWFTFRALTRVSIRPRTLNIAVSEIIWSAGFAGVGGVVCMLEPMGLVVTAVMGFLLAGLRSVEDLARPSNTICVGLVIIALFLTKYTLPATVVPGLVLGVFSLCSDWQQARASFWTLVKIGLISLAGFSAWYVIADSAAIRAYIFEYPARGWAIGPNFLLQYPKLIVTEMFLNPLYGSLVVAIAIFGGIKNKSLVSRVASFSIICTIIIHALLAERGLRFILTIAPFIWILFGLGIRALFERFSRLNSLLVSAAMIAFVSVSLFLYTKQFNQKLNEILEYTPGHEVLAIPYKEFLLKSQKNVVTFNFTDKPVYFYNFLAMTENMISPRDYFARYRDATTEELSSIAKAASSAQLKNILNSFKADILVLMDNSSPESLTLRQNLLSDFCKAIECEFYNISGSKILRFEHVQLANDLILENRPANIR